uniref:Uncharacterized protein n=1 Tax=Otus sunia TaxID=257818 RepID=A0A8C8BBI5_9STRI
MGLRSTRITFKCQYTSLLCGPDGFGGLRLCPSSHPAAAVAPRQSEGQVLGVKPAFTFLWCKQHYTRWYTDNPTCGH